MKKRSKLIVLLLMILTLCFSGAALSACGGDDDGNSGRPTITYYLYSGDAPVTTIVFDGKFSLRVLPTKPHSTFLGLYDAPTGGTQIVDETGRCSIIIDHNITLWAHWESEQCTITYNPDGGTLTSGERVYNIYYDNDITAMPTASREGYDFTGWFSNGHKVADNSGVVNKDCTKFNTSNYTFDTNTNNVTLIAGWTIKRCKITLDYNDYSTPEGEITVDYGTLLTDVTLPEKDTGSKMIVGWSTNKFNLSDLNITVTSDTTVLYAIWKDYRVFTFIDKRTNTTTKHTLYDGDRYQIPDPDYEFPGYSFYGWYSSEFFSGYATEYLEYGTHADTYYARWEAETHYITFVTNGGSNQIPRKSFTVEQDVTLPTAEEVGEKLHCEFLGWCRNKDQTDSAITVLRAGDATSDITLYAKWRGERRVVNLEPFDGVLLSGTTKNVEYGCPYNLGVPVLDGYEFQGWFDSAEGGSAFTGKDGKCDDDWTADSGITLYAQYKKKYFVTVTATHGNAATIKYKDYYTEGESATISVENVGAGYTYLGIFDGTGRQLTSQKTYTFVMETPQSTMQFTVKFVAAKTNVTLNADGGRIKDNIPVQIEYGSEYKLAVPYKAGYIFKGWMYNDKAITNPNGKGITTWNITDSTVTLKASYEKDNDPTPKVMIFDAEDFLKIKDNPSGKYALGDNIDLSTVMYEPFDFSGTLDGCDYSITGLSLIANKGNMGLFLTLTGNVSNLELDDIIIVSTASDHVKIGGVCAVLKGGNGGVIENVTVSGEISVSGRADVAGIVGHVQTGGIVRDCISNVIVDGNKVTDTGTAGGIVGWLEVGKIENCENNGQITGKHNTGGIAGGVSNSTDSYIKDCVNKGKVVGAIYTGGITGSAQLLKQLLSCTNEGEILGFDRVATGDYTGGVIGAFKLSGSAQTLNSKLENKGKVSGRDFVGGIIGSIEGNVAVGINDFKNSGDVTGCYNIGGIIGIYNGGKLTAQGLSNTGSVTASGYRIGGLIGRAISTDDLSYVTGTSSAVISGKAIVGGIVGMAEKVTLKSCDNSGSTVTVSEYETLNNVNNAYLGGYVGKGYGVDDCDNAVAITYDGEGQCVGGIAGYVAGNINSCDNSASVTANNSIGDVGGIVGGSGGWYISNSSNSGAVSAAKADRVGGIVGGSINKGSGVVALSNDSNDQATVTGKNQVGGIAGCVDVNKLNVTSATNTGDVIASAYDVGGIIGYAVSVSNTDSNVNGNVSASVSGVARVGGIVGRAVNVTVKNSQNTGSTVTATGFYTDNNTNYAYVGGIVGYGYSVTDCDNEVSIMYTGNGGYVGGIAGFISGYINFCDNSAAVTANNSVGDVGGVAGSSAALPIGCTNSGIISAQNSSYVGGVVGSIRNETLVAEIVEYKSSERITNRGVVNGKQWVGGIIGFVSVQKLNIVSLAQGYMIVNTGNVTGSDMCVGGVFGYVKAKDSSSTVCATSSATVSGTALVGGIAGYAPSVILDHCSNDNSSVTATGSSPDNSSIPSGAYLGGFVGYGYKISYLNNNVAVTYSDYGSYVGGVAGYVTDAITSCTNNANVFAQSSDCVGGIAGGMYYTVSLQLVTLTNNGTVKGNNHVGGIIGYVADSFGKNNNNYASETLTMNILNNTGSVEGGQNVGGLIGYIKVNSIAGIRLTLSDAGSVSGDQNVGGLIGYGQVKTDSSVRGTVSGSVIKDGVMIADAIGNDDSNITIS